MNFTELHFTKIANGWVVQFTQHIQGHAEQSALAFPNLQAAVDWMNKNAAPSGMPPSPIGKPKEEAK